MSAVGAADPSAYCPDSGLIGRRELTADSEGGNVWGSLRAVADPSALEAGRQD
jgi:hypothetical protein